MSLTLLYVPCLGTSYSGTLKTNLFIFLLNQKKKKKKKEIENQSGGLLATNL